jgi:glycerol kinase
MAILAIDQGTSATKAIVVDGPRVLGLAEVPVEVIATPDGGVELDPERLWDSVLHAGRAALRDAGSPTLAGIGLANQGETVVAWRRSNGEAIGRAIVWQDRRSVGECERRAADARWLAAATGLELDPYFVAPKIAWLRGQVPSDCVITTTDTWLLHRLCGAFVTDVATAGRTLLLDLDECRWHERACGLFGIEPDSLPTIVGNATPIGICSWFGGAVPVTGACVDQQAALYAERCREVGEAKCTYGTGAFLLASTGSTPTRSTNGLVGCPAWQIDGATTWCLDGQVYTVGAAVTWLMDVGIIGEPADLDRLGAGVADSGGTAIDGIAAQVALLASAAAADLGAPLQRLRVDGGLTRSELLLQTQADLLQVPVEVYPSPHATAIGVAAFAALGAGLTDDPAGWVPARVVEPAIGADEAEGRLDTWRRAAAATMEL